MISLRSGSMILGFGAALMAAALLPAAMAHATPPPPPAAVVIVPSDPDELDDISIVIRGVWPNACAPKNPVLAPIVGSEIRIDTSNPGVICALVLTPFELTVDAGQLPAGDYLVKVIHHADGFPPFEIARQAFAVTESEVSGAIASGSAAKVGACPNGDGNGQVRISGALPGGQVDLRFCTFVLDHLLFYRAIDQELVTDKTGVPIDEFAGSLSCKRDAHNMTCESSSKKRPTFKARVTDRGRGELEFTLNVDRSIIGSCSAPPLPAPLETAFSIVCPSREFKFFDNPTWCVSGLGNIRTPCF